MRGGQGARVAAAIAVLLVLVGVLALARGGGGDDPTTTSAPVAAETTPAAAEAAPAGTTARPTATAAEEEAASAPDVATEAEPAGPAPSGLPTVELDELPAEALDTLALIDAGGPYPFRADGGTFQNREGILPDRPRGWYAEYTVVTPGEDDRGARRIVAGEDGALFYTDDHYDSFREVVR